MIHTNYKRLFPTLAISLLLTACANQDRNLAEVPLAEPVRQQSVRQVMLGRAVDKPLNLIAQDLVSALSQIDQVRAAGMVVRLPNASTRFDVALESSLIKGGFTIQNVNNKAGGNILRTAVNRKSGSNEYTHAIALDQLALKRSYSIVGKQVAPISSLFVRGVSPGNIKLDDRIFITENGLKNSNTASKAMTRTASGKPFLCTPEGKGRNTDGWVCREGVSGKQWVDADQHNALLDSGYKVSTLEWDRLMALPDIIILSEQEIRAASGGNSRQFQAGSLYLCTPDGKGVGTDGWLCREGEAGKQWISVKERTALLRSGTPERRVRWDSLMAMADREFIR